MKFKYLLLSLILIIGIAITLFFIYGERWAENKLERKLEEIEHLSYDSLIVELEKNQLTFQGLKYKHQNIEVFIKEVSIKDISPYKILVQNRLYINQLTVDSARVNYISQSNKKSKTNAVSKVSELPIDVEINHVDLLNTGFKIFNSEDKNPFIESNLDLTLTGVKIHEIKELTDLVPLIEAFNLSNLTYRSATNRYHIEFPLLSYSKAEEAILIKSVKVLPQHNKYEFAHVVGHEIDWMKASIDSLFIEFSSLDSAIKNKQIKKLFIHQPRLEIFRDKRLPFPDNQRPKLLKELLAAEESNFAIDSIFIINGDIVYEEHVKEADQPGKVTFKELNGSVVNLYTYNKNYNERPRLTARCKLFDATTLFADISFPSTLNEATIVKGKVEPVDLTVFNQMLEHVAFTRIKSGQLNQLDFDFSYDRKNSNGEMRFDYNNLHVEFLKKETNESGGFFNEIKEFVANAFVVNSNNGTNGKIRIGDIDFERNMEKSMFNLWWKSILTGFKSSTGIKPPEKKVREE